MDILTVAVVAVGILCMLDLLLTFGVIRRLREHAQLIESLRMPDVPLTGLVSGEHVASFSVAAIDGNLVAGPSGLRVAGFFSSSCSSCLERVGPFLDYLAAHQVAPEQALSVVVGRKDDRPPYVGRLAQVSRVCAEQDDGDVSKAFKVRGFPLFFVLDPDQAVVGTSYDPAALPEAGVIP